MEYEIDTELELNPEMPGETSVIETATDHPSMRPAEHANEECDEQKAVLIPEEEDQG